MISEIKKHNCEKCFFSRKLLHTHHLLCSFPGYITSGKSHLINDIVNKIVDKKEEGKKYRLSTMTKLKLRQENIIQTAYDMLNIMLDEHAINEGWCTWPFNFDPIWIKRCNIIKLITDSKEINVQILANQIEEVRKINAMEGN